MITILLDKAQIPPNLLNARCTLGESTFAIETIAAKMNTACTCSTVTRNSATRSTLAGSPGLFFRPSTGKHACSVLSIENLMVSYFCITRHEAASKFAYSHFNRALMTLDIHFRDKTDQEATMRSFRLQCDLTLSLCRCWTKVLCTVVSPAKAFRQTRQATSVTVARWLIRSEWSIDYFL